MPGRNQIRPQVQGMIEKGAELDFPVTYDIRIWRTPCPVFAQEIFKHTVPVFMRKIDRVQGNTQAITNGLGISEIFFCRTVTGLIILFPVLHEQTLYLIALLLQQEGRD
jgi:hypothetical protein